MQWIDAPTIARLLDYPSLCSALAEAHRNQKPVTAEIHLEHPGQPESFMLRPAWSEHQLLGVKLATTFPKNNSLAAPMPSVQGLYVAFDGMTGEPKFLADGAALTAWKTAADSALGLDLLAPQDVEAMLMVGAGEMAAHQINACTALRPSIRKVRVWNRTKSRADKLVRSIVIEGVEISASHDLDDCLAN